MNKSMISQRPVTVVRRGFRWYLKRNVPQKYHDVEPRRQIWKALKAPNEAAAIREAKAFWARQVREWEERLPIESGRGRQHIRRQIKTMAKSLGYNYLPVHEVAKLPLEDLLKRVEATVLPDSAENVVDLTIAQALLGGLSETLHLSDVLAEFLHAERYRVLNKTPAQKRQWEMAYQLPFRRLIEHFGDIDIRNIPHSELYQLVTNDWLFERDPPLAVRTVNARICKLRNALEFVTDSRGQRSPIDLSSFLNRAEPSRQRPAFSTQWISDRLLAPGALAGLETDDRLLILGMINTGYRVSEGANLMPKEICLEAKIPHLDIQGAFASLKRPASVRRIPLVGVSLQAFRQAPNGFARLRGSPAVSARLNRFLTLANLRETPEHTLHSFRHSFSFRLARVGISEVLIADLMGHKIRRGYGRGAPLELRQDAVEKIAL